MVHHNDHYDLYDHYDHYDHYEYYDHYHYYDHYGYYDYYDCHVNVVHSTSACVQQLVPEFG